MSDQRSKPGQGRYRQVKVLFNDEEYDKLREVAFVQEQRVAVWCREAINAEVNKVYKQPKKP